MQVLVISGPMYFKKIKEKVRRSSVVSMSERLELSEWWKVLDTC